MMTAWIVGYVVVSLAALLVVLAIFRGGKGSDEERESLDEEGRFWKEHQDD